MMKLFYSVVLSALMVFSAADASAGELKLTMQNGRVTLIAQDVPVRQILTEWARIGNTKIVNLEKVMGAPVTLMLIDRPEREVLDAVLRNVAGYVAAPRAAGTQGAATFDRIFILATSQAPAHTPVASAPTFTRPQVAVPMPEDDPPVEQPNMMPPGAHPPGAQPGNMPPGAVPGPQSMPTPGMPPGATAPGMQGGPNAPLTAPRPGMLPPPTPGPTNPYGPPTMTRPPGGRGGGPGGQ